MKIKSFIKIIVLISFLSSLFIACSSIPQLQSERASRPITIDGDKKDWDDKSTFIEDANLSLSISNDDQYLYIYASTSEKMSLLARGITIWFDSTGSKDTYFGIHFPLGMKGKMGQMQQESLQRPDDQENNEEQPNQNDPRKNKMRSFRDPISEMDKFEILGEDTKDKRTIYLKEDGPIKVALKDNQFSVGYEARIPLYLMNNFKYAINPGSSKTISLGFEFGEIEKNKRSSGGSGGGPGGAPPDGGGGMGGPGGGMGGPGGGGMGGPGGGRSGGRSGDREGGAPEMADMEDFWIKVVLK